MADRTELVQIKVTPEEKQKFREYVESTNEFDSLSRIFRVLAHRHIETDGQQEATVDTDSDRTPEKETDPDSILNFT